MYIYIYIYIDANELYFTDVIVRTFSIEQIFHACAVCTYNIGYSSDMILAETKRRKHIKRTEDDVTATHNVETTKSMFTFW